MIFLGDVAVPLCVQPRIEGVPWGKAECVVANLEGAYALSDTEVSTKLVNTDSTGPIFEACAIKAVSLANNHITDLGVDFAGTLEWLDRIGVASFGAGSDATTASAPIYLRDGDRRVGILGFGWHVIGCRPASSVAGVNKLTTDHVLRSIDAFRSQDSISPLVLFMHWDYELEVYPQPAHRQLAMAAIERGANAVVGCHSHCMQGIEYHRHSPIVYGLGNWFLAEGVFKRGKLRFPPFARRELAFEWLGSEALDKCHVFEYFPQDQRLSHVATSDIPTWQEKEGLTPFLGMSHKDYVEWFKVNRRKRKFLPVYVDYQAHRRNSVFDLFVAARQRILDLLVATRVKGGPR